MGQRVARNIDRAILECRTTGHQWEPVNVRRRNDWGIPVNYRCVRCPKERYDIYDLQGNLSTRSYNDPPEYKLVGEKITKGDLRLELFSRMRAGQRNAPKRKLRIVN